MLAMASVPADLAGVALDLATRFPKAAQSIWKTAQTVWKRYNNLSPESRRSVQVAIAKSKTTTSFLYRTLQQLYPNALHWGARSVQDWRQPPYMLLWPIANAVLLILPADVVWSNIDLPEKRIAYIGNHCLFGIDTLATLSSIYLKTGILPRTVLDHLHFQVPLWKQTVEYFGAVDSSCNNAVESLMDFDFDVLLYPGGHHESLRKSNQGRYGLLWDPDMTGDIHAGLLKYGYVVVPVANIGVNNMLKPVYDLKWNPRSSTSIPIAIPVSYERQYITFYRPLNPIDDNGEELIKDALEDTIIDTIARRRDAGEQRVLLRNVRNVISSLLRGFGPLVISAGNALLTHSAKAANAALDRFSDPKNSM